MAAAVVGRGDSLYDIEMKVLIRDGLMTDNEIDTLIAQARREKASVGRSTRLHLGTPRLEGNRERKINGKGRS
jgi:hypothetical protein